MKQAEKALACEKKLLLLGKTDHHQISHHQISQQAVATKTGGQHCDLGSGEAGPHEGRWSGDILSEDLVPELRHTEERSPAGCSVPPLPLLVKEERMVGEHGL